LAEGDILRFDKVVEEPLEKCLLYLAYKADKNQVDSLMHKEMLKGMGS
jgi:predicted transport protein